jgi:hypothetical protein
LSVCAIYEYEKSFANDLGQVTYASVAPADSPALHSETNTHTGSLAAGAPVPLTEKWTLYPTFSVALAVSDSRIESGPFISGNRYGVLGISPGLGFVYRDRMAFTVTLGWIVEHPEEFETGMVTAIRFSLRLGQR